MNEYRIIIHGIGEFRPALGLTIQLLAALICGTLIGLDRETKQKSAGLRTNILISIGSMVFTTISLINMNQHVTTGPADPNRVIGQIVNGIGFLGAGAIIQSRGNIIGLTTAASIWIVAALGATCGAGLVIEALSFSILVVIILRHSTYLLNAMPSSRAKKLYCLEILSMGDISDDLAKTLEFRKFDIKEKNSVQINAENNTFLTSFVLSESTKNMVRLANKCRRLVRVQKVTYVNYKKFVPEKHEEE